MPVMSKNCWPRHATSFGTVAKKKRFLTPFPGPKQVRTHLIETARPLMEAMVEEITGVKIVSLHHDISTITGEEVVLFTLAAPPALRDGRKK